MLLRRALPALLAPALAASLLQGRREELYDGEEEDYDLWSDGEEYQAGHADGAPWKKPREKTDIEKEREANQKQNLVEGKKAYMAGGDAWVLEVDPKWDGTPTAMNASERQLLLANRSVKRVAVCSSGHLRTFGLPGVHTSMVKNLIETIPWEGARVDVYLDGIVANRGHWRWYKDFQVPEAASDPQVQAGLEALKPYAKNIEIYDVRKNDCLVLREAWKRDGIANRSCRKSSHDSNFFQFMFMDRCMQKIFKADEQYDFIIKTRPDVAFFEPFPWLSLSTETISFMPKRYGAGEDWMFVMPGSIAKAYWDQQVKFYMDIPSWAGRFMRQPDHKFFPKSCSERCDRSEDMGKEADATRPFLKNPMLFPAVIVRGLGHEYVDCIRVQSQYYQEPCFAARDAGNMTTVTHEMRRHGK